MPLRLLLRRGGWSGLAAIGLVPLLLACFPQQNRGGGGVTPAAGTSGWRTNAPAGTGFSVSMPGQAQLEYETETEIDGARATVVEGTVVSGQMFFEFAVRTVDGGLAGGVEDLREPNQNISENRSFNDLRVREERSYRHESGYRVLETIFDSKTDGGLAFTAYIRVYVGRTRVIRTTVALPTAQETIYSTQARYFFDSVRLDPADSASPAGNGAIDLDGWSWAYPPEGSFAAYYPGQPRYTSSTFMHDDDERTIHRYVVGGNGAEPSFVVRAIDYGERPPEEALETARGFWIREGWTLSGERPVERRGFGGVELVLRKDGRTTRVRYYATNAGLYEIYVERPDTTTDAVDQAERRFFASFRML
ncbi:MAG: hypothetical protein AAGH15_20535 [Myxococcota bacterium]